MAEHITPRVNAARMPDFKNHTVRVFGKILRLDDDANEVIIQASDGGELRVQFVSPPTLSSQYIEVIGKVAKDDTLKAQAIVELTDNFDMELADFVVQMWHDPRFEVMTGMKDFKLQA